MRTTLTLEDDIAVRLERIRKEKHLSMKKIINESLRAGLDELEKKKSGVSGSYRLKSVKLGKKLPDLDNIADVLALDNEAGR